MRIIVIQIILYLLYLPALHSEESNKNTCPQINIMTTDYSRMINMRFVGDIVLPQNNQNLNNQNNEKFLFDGISEYFSSADVTFGNLEGVLTNLKTPRRKAEEGKIYNFSFDPIYANLLKKARFNILNIANNHSLDYGDEGFNDTIRYLTGVDILPIGIKNDLQIKTIKGLRIGFIGFGFYPYQNEIQNIQQAVKTVNDAKKHTDFLVVSFHGGGEGPNTLWHDNKFEYFLDENRGNTVAFARAVIDAGANAVIGHAPHVLRSIECYNGKPIAYSLGNFLTTGGLSNNGFNRLSIIYGLQLDLNGKIIKIEVLPIKQTIRKIPWFDADYSAVSLINKISESSHFKGTFLKISTDKNNSLQYSNLYSDAIEGKKIFTINEIINLTKYTKIKNIDMLTVKGNSFEINNATAYLNFLRDEKKLKRLITLEFNNNFLSH